MRKYEKAHQFWRLAFVRGHHEPTLDQQSLDRRPREPIHHPAHRGMTTVLDLDPIAVAANAANATDPISQKSHHSPLCPRNTVEAAVPALSIVSVI